MQVARKTASPRSGGKETLSGKSIATAHTTNGSTRIRGMWRVEVVRHGKLLMKNVRIQLVGRYTTQDQGLVLLRLGS